MKKIALLLILSLVFSFPLFAQSGEKIILVSKPDGSVAIVHYYLGSSKTLVQVLYDLGFESYPLQEISEADVPQDRSDRPFWKKGVIKPIEVDQVKKQAHLDKVAAKKAKKDAALAKIHLTEQEWSELTDKAVNTSVHP